MGLDVRHGCAIATGSVGRIERGSLEARSRLDRQPVAEWIGAGANLVGAVASANALAIARNVRDSAPTAEGSARV